MNELTEYRGAYNITSRRANGERYTVHRTPRGYIVGGVLFMDAAAALAAAVYHNDLFTDAANTRGDGEIL